MSDLNLRNAPAPFRDILKDLQARGILSNPKVKATFIAQAKAVAATKVNPVKVTNDDSSH